MNAPDTNRERGSPSSARRGLSTAGSSCSSYNGNDYNVIGNLLQGSLGLLSSSNAGDGALPLAVGTYDDASPTTQPVGQLLVDVLYENPMVL